MKPNFGENIVVIGLGLVGLISCQLLKASGCRVIGTDIDPYKCAMAKQYGIEIINSSTGNLVQETKFLTKDQGADGVLITASTKSDKIISEAAEISRKRGQIVLVGVVGLNLNRSDFYEKELTFQVSCSYGPGRYDENYENFGLDYPFSFVRWTEKRNFEAILQAMHNKSLDVGSLITKKVEFKNFKEIYGNLKNNNSIASILVYPRSKKEIVERKDLVLKDNIFHKRKCIIGIVGSGNYTKVKILPILRKLRAQIIYIASNSGLTSTHLAKKFKINVSTTDYRMILKDPEVDTVIIATRHHMHSRMIIEALKLGKNVFVEKPLAINSTQLENIIKAVAKSKNSNIMVGFNRRFSPHIVAIKNSLGTAGNINIIATMNAGYLPKDHWTNNLEIGGGRIIGEACHLIDLCVFLTGSLIKSVCMNSLGESPTLDTEDVSLLLKFKNGSNCSINYFSNGSSKYSKERLEVFSQGRTWIVEDYQKSIGYNVPNFKYKKTLLDKGQFSQFKKYLEGIKNGSNSLIPMEELINVTKASFGALESLKNNKWVTID